jgi:phosphorylcholine metabolism protein LicD
MRQFNKIISIQILYELTQILKNYNINYWLQDGTLLGYYRENDLISHDNDTDIGLFWNDSINYKNALNEILKNNFKLFKIKGYMKDSLMLTFIKNEQKVDLFFYYTRGNKIYHTALGKDWIVVEYEYEPFDVKTINFLNYDFNVPEDELKFIETKYGSNWKIPDEKWNNIHDPKNSIITNKYVDIKKCKKEFKTWLLK